MLTLASAAIMLMQATPPLEYFQRPALIADRTFDTVYLTEELLDSRNLGSQFDATLTISYSDKAAPIPLNCAWFPITTHPDRYAQSGETTASLVQTTQFLYDKKGYRGPTLYCFQQSNDWPLNTSTITLPAPGIIVREYPATDPFPAHTILTYAKGWIAVFTKTP